MSTQEQQSAVHYIASKLLKTDLNPENPERMARHLLTIYNWDISTVEKYVI